MEKYKLWGTAALAMTILAGGCGLYGGAGPNNNVPRGAKGQQPYGVSDINNTQNPALDHKANRTRLKKVVADSKIPPSQAAIQAGSVVFARDCASCHGNQGIGTTGAPRLAAPSGVVSTFDNEARLKTFIALHMPANHPGTLSAKDAINVSQYVWHIAKGK
ncbi:MAG: hypothetical protein C7B44_15955 [Sulfobacillus thermosulfidooxidans]|uniref:Cytochrome c domain-containing protein n=1 Tax=Sulfobacillus thermotolerans TaxID=338644 RepID=A0ABM6RNK7_9FIRM|nr:c-type cytochrome [Sulfobacillus sp. hq2]AUW92918.1 hypothetical protein BXT84_02305 [Sulfobacillus thermotolerans]MCY0907161.1 c-type cytochrome [Sulfobacillus thermotolerans]POB11219.1 hypothetical protein CO251_06670 [Sulfobacillus sp. hq2]PSR30503.1 MAG: hypothetical protein C7B44_15955 [Sulfobacillus thermosulfidooxidans]